MNEKIDAYWFAASDRLPHGDNRRVVIGKTHSINGDIVLCKNALHASRDPFGALAFAPGQYLYKVSVWGDIVEDDSKLGARHRQYNAMRDSTAMLLRFSREQALSVLHLWKPPMVVRQYLETGDVSLRALAGAASKAAAEAAAGAAAEDAAGAAARAAFWAAVRDAAWIAAWATALDAAGATALDAAGVAAWDAAWDASGRRFNELVAELFSEAAP